jgi:hypothetical protein
MTLWSTRASSSNAVMQIFFLRTNPPLPPLSELTVVHRIAPSRRPD